MYYKKVRFTAKWDRYYKLGQDLSKRGAGCLLQSGSIVLQSGIGIIKWGNFIAKWGYYRKGQYVLVTLGQMETYVYRQDQCGLRTEFWGLLRLSTKQFFSMFVSEG